MKYIIFITILLIALAGCTTNTELESDSCSIDGLCTIDTESLNKVSESSPVNNVEKIEVYHFHGESQCFSCKTIKEFAEETVNTHFQDLLKSGKMEFKSIDVTLPENREITMKYGATGSSLWIGTYIDGKFNKEENTNVWYKVKDEADFTSYLKGLLDKRLTGDLN